MCHILVCESGTRLVCETGRRFVCETGRETTKKKKKYTETFWTLICLYTFTLKIYLLGILLLPVVMLTYIYM